MQSAFEVRYVDSLLASFRSKAEVREEQAGFVSLGIYSRRYNTDEEESDRVMSRSAKRTVAGRFIIAASSDRGLVRSSNEDYYGIYTPDESSIHSYGILVVVADGMGGHLSGAEASKRAVEALAAA